MLRKLLAEPDCNLLEKDDNEWTAFHHACSSKRRHEIAKLLFEHEDAQFIIDAKEKDGLTPLMITVHNNVLSTARLLIAYNAGLDEVDFNGNTALHWVLQKKNLAFMKLLVSAGANPNIPNNDKKTALDLDGDKVLAKLIAVQNKSSIPPPSLPESMENDSYEPEGKHITAYI